MSIPAPDAASRLAAIVESSDDAIISKDLNGIITSWNRGAEQLFGYAAEEAVGQSITLVIPPDRLGEEDIVLARIRRGERVKPFDTVRWRKDGTLVDVSLTISPIRDRTGAVIGASKIARNITDRKRVEAELRDLQSRMTGLAVASATILGSPNVDAVLSATIDLAREVFAADGCALWRIDDAKAWRIFKSFGISAEFAARVITIGNATAGAPRVPFADPLVCEDVTATAMLADMKEAYAREGIGSMVVFPLTIRAERCGTLVFYSRSRRQYRDVDIQVGSALANIAAASITTAELYDEQRKVREAADHARQQAAFLAEAGTVLSSSLDYEATLAAVARLAVPTIADWCAVDIVAPDGSLQRLAVAHVDPRKVEFARMLQERYPADPNSPGGAHEVIRTGEARFMSRIPTELLDASARDDDHRRLIRELRLTSYMCVPLATHGQAFGAITFVSAESGREYWEGDLRVARELAARASLAVENARSYARANEASRMKDEFLATLSHELRTPLNAVLGYARMLKQGTITHDRTELAFDVIERNATALRQIIEDVVDVSRIVAGRLRLNVEPVDLPAILHEAWATVSPAADAKELRIEAVIDPITDSVSGDPARLLQIVWNLLSNAIKFTPRGGKVQLRLARVNSHVEITVSDTGRGIAPDFLPFVFERYRQGDASFSREHGGLGLGLAIAKQLTELHGGAISVASGGVNQGATFTVTLPLMIVHATSETGPRQQPRTERHAPALDVVPRLDGVHVLAIDDEADSLHLLRIVLEGAGATVTTAANAAAALETVQRERADVIVADIGMPGIDGLQMIRALRQMEEPIRSTPAAALTAYARSQDRIMSLASGFQMHLVKPVDALELIVAVSTLAARGERRESRTRE
jgi:PAS domain S-box-containing protein